MLKFNGEICQEFVTHHVFELSVQWMANSSLYFAHQDIRLNLFLRVTPIIYPDGMQHMKCLYVLAHINVGNSKVCPRSSLKLDIFPYWCGYDPRTTSLIWYVYPSYSRKPMDMMFSIPCNINHINRFPQYPFSPEIATPALHFSCRVLSDALIFWR